jgi:glutamate dehydrogenase/leucine dehydrogenase
MKETFNNVYNKHINENISMRVACYILAIHKIEQIIKKKRIF